MGRRRRDRSGERAEALFKLGLGFLMLIALGIGGVSGFGQVLSSLLWMIIITVVSVGALAVLGLILYKVYRSRRTSPISDVHAAYYRQQSPASSTATYTPPPSSATFRPAPARSPAWSVAEISNALDEIDWYQFEKFCAALLEADGFHVERKGGAHPDGGVDLLVEKGGTRGLIQCKHWRTWEVKEGVVREMLGSMTDFKVSHAAIYTLKGWTAPAAQFAAKHSITLVNGAELAQSAKLQLSPDKLEALLRPREHHCPKCESPMLWKTGNFTPFWGCSRYPRCDGKFKHSRAR